MWRRIHFGACFAALLTLALSGPVGAEDQANTPESASESQVLAREILMNMAGFLAGLEKFSVTVRGGYDVLQESGQKIEFLEARDIAVARPGRLRAAGTDSSGRSSVVLFDGRVITVYDGEAGVYAQAPQPGNVDDSLVYFTRDLELRLPLAVLATTRLPLELERRVRYVDYVEQSYAFDEPTHHVTGRTDVVDFQLWITDGEQPWLQRIVLNYYKEPGQPQYRAEFSDWKSKPRLSKSFFRFEPSRGDRQIVFAAQLPPAEPATDTARPSAEAEGQQ